MIRVVTYQIWKVVRTPSSYWKNVSEFTQQPLSLFIADRPILIREKSSQRTTFSSLDSGEDVTLTCEFDGFPTPEIKFQKDSNELNTSDVTSRPGFVSYKFRVRNQGDFGFYSCVATNSRGTETYYMELYERGKLNLIVCLRFLSSRRVWARMVFRGVWSERKFESRERPWGPFLESPGNLTVQKSYFEIRVLSKVGCVLTSNEVHFVSLADNFTVQLSKLLKLPSSMENKTGSFEKRAPGPRKEIENL